MQDVVILKVFNIYCGEFVNISVKSTFLTVCPNASQYNYTDLEYKGVLDYLHNESGPAWWYDDPVILCKKHGYKNKFLDNYFIDGRHLDKMEWEVMLFNKKLGEICNAS